MSWMKNAASLLALTSILILCTACETYEQSREKRAALARADTGDIDIAVVWPQQLEAGHFMKGVRLALEQVNANGIYADRRFEAHIFNETSRETGAQIARKIARDPQIVASIGHYGSSRSLPAAVTYEYHGILYVSPVATSPSLTRYGFGYLFRNIPSDAEIAKAILQQSVRNSWEKAAIVHVRGDYGQNFSQMFQEQAFYKDVQVPVVKSYAAHQTNFRRMIVEMRRQEYDFVFLADVVPRAAEFIRQYREMGGTEPFIGGDGLDSNLLWQIAGEDAEGTQVATTFNPQSQRPQIRQFVQDFRERWDGLTPDFLAAQGYDAVQLLARSMAYSQSAEPIVVATSMRFSDPMTGVLGTYSVELDGGISGKDIAFKELVSGNFRLMADIDEE